ncbi:MAG: metal-dependent transcriptional regulator [Gemmatimonadota bacterium]|nr:metal-dependent transcriptional regulator [Gemmatimonadota bacterium]
MEIWKEFEHNEITHSAAHYLMTINKLIDDQGYSRVSDVARSLNITAGSASIMLKNLKEKGFLEEDRNRFLRLSESGNRLTHSIRSHRHIMITFFRDVLHINPEQAEIDACKIEHLISTETAEHLLSFLQFLMCGSPQAKAFLDRYWDSKNELCDLASCAVCHDAGECLLGPIETQTEDTTD